MPDIASRVRLLRRRLDLTQEEVTARATQRVPTFQRSYVSKVETGKNKLTSADMREGFAFAFGLELADFNAYVAGRITIDDALARARPVASAVSPVSGTAPAEAAPQRTAAPPREDAPSLEGLLFDVRVQGVHDVSDFDNARRVVREVPPFPRERVDLGELAKSYLDAARSQRLDGLPTSTPAILNRALLERMPQARAPAGGAEAPGRAAPRGRDVRGAETV